MLLINVGGSTAVDGDRSWLVAFLDLFWDRVGWEIGWTPSDETIQRDDHTWFAALESVLVLLTASFGEN